MLRVDMASDGGESAAARSVRFVLRRSRWIPIYALAVLMIVTLVWFLLGSKQDQEQDPTSSLPEASQKIRSLKTELKINQYTIRLFENTSILEQSIEILRDDQLVYTDGGVGAHFFVEADRVGEDITGEGAPELVVESYSGGAHCCFSYDIFALGPQFRLVTHLDGPSCRFDFQDLDGDRIAEAIGCDETFAYWHTCYACFRSPSVILRFRDGRYHLAPDLMKRTTPTAEELEAKLRAIAQEWDSHRTEIGLPSQVWEYMLELIYSGNNLVAWRFLDMAWPEGKEGKEGFLQEFKEQLVASPYWVDLKDTIR